MKKKPTIAQKTVAKKQKRRKFRDILPWILCPPLAVLAYLLKFVFQGYSFSALVCCILIGLILFYAITGNLNWQWVPVLRKFVTVCLILGLIVCAATEVLILRASLGDPVTPVEYIVVLGAKVRNTGPSVALKERIRGAYDYLAAHPDAIAVVSGGQGDDEPMPEAKAMFDGLVALGIDPQRVWMEDQATSTWENIQFSLNLIEEKTGQRPTKLGVVSSEYHLFRAGLFTEAAGAEFVGIPAHTTRVSQKINHFMREIAGVWYYWILGGTYDA